MNNSLNTDILSINLPISITISDSIVFTTDYNITIDPNKKNITVINFKIFSKILLSEINNSNLNRMGRLNF